MNAAQIAVNTLCIAQRSSSRTCLLGIRVLQRLKLRARATIVCRNMARVASPLICSHSFVVDCGLQQTR